MNQIFIEQTEATCQEKAQEASLDIWKLLGNLIQVSMFW